MNAPAVENYWCCWTGNWSVRPAQVETSAGGSRQPQKHKTHDASSSCGVQLTLLPRFRVSRRRVPPACAVKGDCSAHRPNSPPCRESFSRWSSRRVVSRTEPREKKMRLRERHGSTSVFGVVLAKQPDIPLQ